MEKKFKLFFLDGCISFKELHENKAVLEKNRFFHVIYKNKKQLNYENK